MFHAKGRMAEQYQLSRVRSLICHRDVHMAMSRLGSLPRCDDRFTVVLTEAA